MKVVAINNGYYSVKGEKGLIFNSSYSIPMDNCYSGGVDNMVFEGKKYLIGGGTPSLDKDKTSDIATKLFVLNALARYMDDSQKEEDFKVVLSSPPLNYGTQKEKLPEYLKGSYDIVHNSHKKTINIIDVSVYPEAIMAYLANNPSQFKNPVMVIDIGGFTTTIAYIVNGVYNKNSFINLTKGMHLLESTIASHISSKYSISLNQENCPDFLSKLDEKDSYMYSILKKEKSTIDNIFDSHLNDVKCELNIKQWSPEMCDILVTGGGGKRLIERIQARYPHAQLSNSPLFDNLNGLKMVAEKERRAMNYSEVAVTR